MTDEVLREVRAAREAFSALHGHNVHSMAATLRKLDEAGDWPVADLDPLPPDYSLTSTKPAAIVNGAVKNEV